MEAPLGGYISYPAIGRQPSGKVGRTERAFFWRETYRNLAVNGGNQGYPGQKQNGRTFVRPLRHTLQMRLKFS